MNAKSSSLGLFALAWRALRTPVRPGARGWMRIGWIALALFVLQGVTGTLLLFHYQATPQEAARSTEYIVREVHWGWLVRGLHQWATHALIVLALLLLLRSIVQRAWRDGRGASWSIGLALLVLSFLLGYSGDLLVWDAQAYWTVVRALEWTETLPVIGPLLAGAVRGSAEVGAATLGRLVSLHAVVLPWLVVLLVSVHLWLMAGRARAGGRS